MKDTWKSLPVYDVWETGQNHSVWVVMPKQYFKPCVHGQVIEHLCRRRVCGSGRAGCGSTSRR